ncbi:MAG: phosphatase PAP2 family protein [Elusimicrobia bacterium]|nr:phosphatase PAP2 family protein [Elusimicrobiota bacterium]
MTSEDRWYMALLAVVFAAAFVLIGVNSLFLHYTGVLYLNRTLIPLLVPLVIAMAYSIFARERWPRACFVLRNGGYYTLSVVAMALLATGIQFTPFARIDPLLAVWDARLHFNLVDAMGWTNAHPLLRSLLSVGYWSIEAQLFCVPMMLLLVQDLRFTRVFVFSLLYSALIGYLFYFFFPSSGPASFYASPLFSEQQRMTYGKFYAVHHFQPVPATDAGLIAFPSFHVVWAVLLVYAGGWNRWLILPVGLLNALMIVASVLLGWHFLVDVPAGVLLALASLMLAEWTHRRLCRLSPQPGATGKLGAAELSRGL